MRKIIFFPFASSEPVGQVEKFINMNNPKKNNFSTQLFKSFTRSVRRSCMRRLGNERVGYYLVLLFFVTLAYPVDKKPMPTPKKETPTTSKPKRVRVDGIKAVFRGSKGADLILESELNRPKLDGTRNTLDSALTNLAFAQKADEYHITPSPEETEKQYEMIARNNNKTKKELDEMVIQAGFTPAEARKEFAQINAVNSLLSYKISGNMVVPESEVVAYYEENPEYEPAAYQIQIALVPFSATQSRPEQLAQLQTLANAKDPNGVINWGEAFWVNEDDLAADKKFITQLSAGEISLPKEVFNGFQMIRLVAKRSKRLKTLDERYGQIVNLLRQPKYNELMGTFQKELMDNASIIIFDVSG